MEFNPIIARFSNALIGGDLGFIQTNSEQITHLFTNNITNGVHCSIPDCECVTLISIFYLLVNTAQDRNGSTNTDLPIQQQNMYNMIVYMINTGIIDVNIICLIDGERHTLLSYSIQNYMGHVSERRFIQLYVQHTSITNIRTYRNQYNADLTQLFLCSIGYDYTNLFCRNLLINSLYFVNSVHNVMIRCDHNVTTLQLAIEKLELDLILLCISDSADVNVLEENRNMLMKLLVENRYEHNTDHLSIIGEIVYELCYDGINLQHIDREGCNILDYLVQCGWVNHPIYTIILEFVNSADFNLEQTDRPIQLLDRCRRDDARNDMPIINMSTDDEFDYSMSEPALLLMRHRFTKNIDQLQLVYQTFNQFTIRDIPLIDCYHSSFRRDYVRRYGWNGTPIDEHLKNIRDDFIELQD